MFLKYLHFWQSIHILGGNPQQFGNSNGSSTQSTEKYPVEQQQQKKALTQWFSGVNTSKDRNESRGRADMPITSDYRYIKISPNTGDLSLSYDSGHRVQSRQSHATQTKHKKPSLNLRVCTEKSLSDYYNHLISCLNLFVDKIISFLIGKKYFKLQYQEFIIAFSHSK